MREHLDGGLLRIEGGSLLKSVLFTRIGNQVSYTNARRRVAESSAPLDSRRGGVKWRPVRTPMIHET